MVRTEQALAREERALTREETKAEAVRIAAREEAVRNVAKEQSEVIRPYEKKVLQMQLEADRIRIHKDQYIT